MRGGLGLAVPVVGCNLSHERETRIEQAAHGAALNAASSELDTLSALEIATVINREDAHVAAAVAHALPQIASAIETTQRGAGARGGRLIYVGAGTSGRIAALDATECPPTFNTDPKLVQYVIAGGEKARGTALEADEDSAGSGPPRPDSP